MCENNVGNACLNTTLDAPLALLYIINLAISLVASVVHFCQAYRHGRAFTYHLLGWTSLVTAPIFLVAFLFANEKFVVVLLGLIYLIQCTHHLLLAGLFSLWMYSMEKYLYYRVYCLGRFMLTSLHLLLLTLSVLRSAFFFKAFADNSSINEGYLKAGILGSGIGLALAILTLSLAGGYLIRSHTTRDSEFKRWQMARVVILAFITAILQLATCIDPYATGVGASVVLVGIFALFSLCWPSAFASFQEAPVVTAEASPPSYNPALPPAPPPPTLIATSPHPTVIYPMMGEFVPAEQPLYPPQPSNSHLENTTLALPEPSNVSTGLDETTMEATSTMAMPVPQMYVLPPETQAQYQKSA